MTDPNGSNAHYSRPGNASLRIRWSSRAPLRSSSSDWLTLPGISRSCEPYVSRWRSRPPAVSPTRQPHTTSVRNETAPPGRCSNVRIRAISAGYPMDGPVVRSAGSEASESASVPEDAYAVGPSRPDAVGARWPRYGSARLSARGRPPSNTLGPVWHPFDSTPQRRSARSPGGLDFQRILDSGAGFEPATFGL